VVQTTFVGAAVLLRPAPVMPATPSTLPVQTYLVPVPNSATGGVAPLRLASSAAQSGTRLMLTVPEATNVTVQAGPRNDFSASEKMTDPPQGAEGVAVIEVISTYFF